MIEPRPLQTRCGEHHVDILLRCVLEHAQVNVPGIERCGAADRGRGRAAHRCKRVVRGGVCTDVAKASESRRRVRERWLVAPVGGGMLCQVFPHVGRMPSYKVLAPPGDLIDERVALEVKMHLELRLPVPVPRLTYPQNHSDF